MNNRVSGGNPILSCINSKIWGVRFLGAWAGLALESFIGCCIWRDLKYAENSIHSQIDTSVTLVAVWRVYLKEANPEAFLMLQSGMTGTWAMIELGRGKAQLAKSKEASIYDSAFVEPKKYSLKDDKDLNMNPSYITSGAELFTSYSILYFWKWGTLLHVIMGIRLDLKYLKQCLNSMSVNGY